MKSVVVTGSTRGIGKGLAKHFLARGCRVVITGRSQSMVDEVVAELNADASSADALIGVACDITRIEDIQAVWDGAIKAFGQVDVWINNAGISVDRKPLWELEAADIESVVGTNLTGLLFANKVVMAGMKGQGRGQDRPSDRQRASNTTKIRTKVQEMYAN